MIIYKTTEIATGLIYIGQSVINNPKYLGSGIILKAKIKKYGKNQFKKEIIEDNIQDKKLLNEREIYWISFYNSTNPKIGMNRSDGGDGGRIIKEYTVELRKKISDAVCNYINNNPITEEQKKKISKSLIGNTRSLGYKHPKSFGEKISNSTKGKKKPSDFGGKISYSQMGEKNHMAKLTKNEVDRIRENYKILKISQQDLSLIFNVSQATIGRIIKNIIWKG